MRTGTPVYQRAGRAKSDTAASISTAFMRYLAPANLLIAHEYIPALNQDQWYPSLITTIGLVTGLGVTVGAIVLLA